MSMKPQTKLSDRDLYTVYFDVTIDCSLSCTECGLWHRYARFCPRRRKTQNSSRCRCRCRCECEEPSFDHKVPLKNTVLPVFDHQPSVISESPASDQANEDTQVPEEPSISGSTPESTPSPNPAAVPEVQSIEDPHVLAAEIPQSPTSAESLADEVPPEQSSTSDSTVTEHAEVPTIEPYISEEAVTAGNTPSCGSWMHKIANRLRRKKKPKMIRDLADIELDEEELKKKYLEGLRLRKRFPYFLTYKFSFLRRYRPVDEEEKENKYSPMAIPDEVYARYFRGVKNPWDYGGSPLPFWTPPKL